MIDAGQIQRALGALGLKHWIDPAIEALAKRLGTSAHGDFPRWQAALAALDDKDPAGVRAALMALSPWRKGPFTLGGIAIDSEWRSDRKWQRVRRALPDLAGERILDVGCGNGYYALEMRKAGAAAVIGIDPAVLSVVQFLAVQRFVADPGVTVMPLRLEELPLPAPAFDTAFSMGVLYHQRSPIEHLRQLRQTLKPGGRLLLETLYLPGEEAFAKTPGSRYARMRNVWLLPSIPELLTWLSRTGYCHIEAVDTSVTGTDEQRTTEWMRFESLAAALDRDDPQRTVEGWPRPHRIVLKARATE